MINFRELVLKTRVYPFRSYIYIKGALRERSPVRNPLEIVFIYSPCCDTLSHKTGSSV